MVYKQEQKSDNQFLEVLDEFDFEKIHSFMKLTNWQWNNSKTVDKIPTAIELKNSLTGMLNLAWEAYVDPTEYSKSYSVSCGGFTIVWIKTDENKEDYFHAAFEFESSDLYLEK